MSVRIQDDGIEQCNNKGEDGAVIESDDSIPSPSHGKSDKVLDSDDAAEASGKSHDNKADRMIMINLGDIGEMSIEEFYKLTDNRRFQLNNGQLVLIPQPDELPSHQWQNILNRARGVINTMNNINWNQCPGCSCYPFIIAVIAALIGFFAFFVVAVFFLALGIYACCRSS